VNGYVAYEDEMNEVALFMTALRAAVPIQPDPELGARLVPRLAQTARAVTIEAETRTTKRADSTAAGARRRPRSRRALVARVGIALALIPLVLAGLAFAGVTLPAPARSVLDSVGVSLPNQSDKSNDTSRSSQGPAQPADESGKSAAGSQGNSAGTHQHALEQRAKAKGEASGHTGGKAIGLNEAVAPGQSGDTGLPAHSNAGGSPENQTHPPHAVLKPKTVHLPPEQALGHLK
jgi:hypothetical protein